ncbi:hypothetical protein Sango_1918700 [Sesamum angolense]|uniref:Uncharacterized protein n=1 Tax=Sesamum angolense TaxID=2727404 RepID=A0AAE1WDT6_9LAMI|nr:hypothetical protein Sango_1918700 [Sesamum angolense]
MEAREEMCKERVVLPESPGVVMRFNSPLITHLIENSEKKVLIEKQRAVSRWPRAVLAADASAEVISKFHFKSMKNI